MSTAVRPTLFALALPIFIENAMHVLTSTIDVLMVSTISDGAVAGLGVAHQFVMVAIMVFSFVGIGSSVVVTHSLGGGDKTGARETAVAAISVNLWLGVLLSIVMALNVPPLLRLMQVPAELFVYAQPYLFILGATLWLEAHNVSIGAVLRAHGHATDAMWVTLIQNIINAVGNAVLLFGLFGAPKMGITGVALATVFSRVVAAAIMIYLLYRRTGIRLRFADLLRVPVERLKRILRIGLPSAGEHLCWWIAYMTTTSFVARMGATELATQSYTMQIVHFVFTFSFSFALANEILVGHHIGAGRFDEAYNTLIRTLKVGLPIVVAALIPMAIFGPNVLEWFTDDTAIIATGTILLRISLLIEPARLVCMVMVCSLRATGDVVYPLKLGLVAMWGVWVPLSWLFGITLGWGLPGIWCAIMVDATIRGSLFMRRWMKRKWMTNAQKSRDGVTASIANLADSA